MKDFAFLLSPFKEVYFIYFKGTVIKRRGDRSPLNWFTFQMLTMAGFEPGKSQSPQLHPGLLQEWQGPKDLGHLLLLFPRSMSRKLDLKWSSWTWTGAQIKGASIGRQQAPASFLQWSSSNGPDGVSVKVNEEVGSSVARQTGRIDRGICRIPARQLLYHEGLIITCVE